MSNWRPLYLFCAALIGILFCNNSFICLIFSILLLKILLKSPFLGTKNTVESFLGTKNTVESFLATFFNGLHINILELL